MTSLDHEKHGPAASQSPIHPNPFDDPPPALPPPRATDDDDDDDTVAESTVDQRSLSLSEKEDGQRELDLPSVVFAIPFPPSANKPPKSGTLPFLIYTLPRATYKKSGVLTPTDPHAAAGTSAAAPDASVDPITPGVDAVPAAGASVPGAELVEQIGETDANATSPVADDTKGKKEDKGPKAPREKVVKKVERLWQEEVQQGDEIHSGRIKDASRWQKIKGGAAHYAGAALRWMPNSTIEALARLPPRKKLGQIAVVYPAEPYAGMPGAVALDDGEMAARLLDSLERARKRAQRTVWLSGAFIPVTGVADFFNPVPMFLLEINVAYFATQFNGARKAQAVTAAGADAFTYHPSLAPSGFDPILAYLHDQCAALKPRLFPAPPSDMPFRRADAELARGLVDMFRARVPEEVWGRHVLDEARVAEDLERCLKKGAKEYVKSL